MPPVQTARISSGRENAENQHCFRLDFPGFQHRQSSHIWTLARPAPVAAAWLRWIFPRMDIRAQAPAQHPRREALKSESPSARIKGHAGGYASPCIPPSVGKRSPWTKGGEHWLRRRRGRADAGSRGAAGTPCRNLMNRLIFAAAWCKI